MALAENTTYKNLSSLLRPMADAVSRVGKILPSPKTVGVNSLKGLGSMVQSFANPGTAQVNPGKLGSVTTPYGGSTKYEGTHPGIDIANKIGTPIPAFTEGTVTDVKTGYKQGAPGYGNYVIVTDPQGNQHRYSHLYQAYVKVGQKIAKGTNIAAMGNTGQTYSLSGGTGSHLDYRIKDIYGKYINPSRYLKG